MIIHINGYPGVGKLTTGRELCRILNGKLLDNHSIYNVAFALTEFRSDVFYETVRAVREIAYDRILNLPRETPVILTNAHVQGSEWSDECWDEVIRLARKRGTPLVVVVLQCDSAEHVRRIQDPERDLKRKPRNPDLLNSYLGRPELMDRGGDHTLHLDVTNLKALESAERVASWIDGIA